MPRKIDFPSIGARTSSRREGCRRQRARAVLAHRVGGATAWNLLARPWRADNSDPRRRTSLSIVWGCEGLRRASNVPHRIWEADRRQRTAVALSIVRRRAGPQHAASGRSGLHRRPGEQRSDRDRLRDGWSRCWRLTPGDRSTQRNHVRGRVGAHGQLHAGNALSASAAGAYGSHESGESPRSILVIWFAPDGIDRLLARPDVRRPLSWTLHASTHELCSLWWRCE